MVYSIIIAGAGQLGSRHLQGLAKYPDKLNVWVYDISQSSLDRARQRWLECETTIHDVIYTDRLEDIPDNIDLAIVASTASVRFQIVSQLTQKIYVKYWILEKILAQSLEELSKIFHATSNSLGSWVNTPRLSWPLYKNIRQFSQGKSIKTAKFLNYKGLICNSIHFVDLVSRWNQTTPVKIDSAGLADRWHSSSRSGFYEIYGSLKISFADGAELFLSSCQDSTELCYSLEFEDASWSVSEKHGCARSSNGQVVHGATLLQSQMTSTLVDSIFRDSSCDLPTLDQSIEQHSLLLKVLLKHWNRSMLASSTYVPIT
jgi:hypothetical protein